MPRYSEEQKGEVLALLDANDGNLKKTRRDIDWDHVPSRSTIRRWDENAQQPKGEPDRAVAKSRHRKKGELADRLQEIAWNLARHIDSKEKIDSATVSQLTTAFGTVVDKMRLLREEATEINEQRDGDEHKRKLEQRLERLRSSQDGPERQ